MAFEGNTWWTYLLFSLIATFALLGNGLVLFVLLKKRSYLKQPYNIFIFSLALTDVLSGVFLVRKVFLNNFWHAHTHRLILFTNIELIVIKVTVIAMESSHC